MIAMKRTMRRLICQVLIGVFLSTQFALAAYPCPGFGDSVGPEAGASASMRAAEASTAMIDDHAAMDGLDAGGHDGHAGFDPQSPNLCTAHCQIGQQATDHTPAPVVSPALLIALYTLPLEDRASASDPSRSSALRTGPPRAGDPPHTILHCCLRD